MRRWNRAALQARRPVGPHLAAGLLLSIGTLPTLGSLELAVRRAGSAYREKRANTTGVDMKIAVIGAGQAGSAIARAVAGAGHSVVVADADAHDAREAAAQAGGSAAGSNEQAAREADLIILAVPFPAIDEVADEIVPVVEGKVVVDASNPLRPDYSGLQVSERSGAERVQERLRSASVVKAFNTVFSNNHDQPVVEGVQLDGFVAGDDQAAKNTVANLLEAIGFRPIDVGGLASALALEHMAFLNISLNARNDLPFRSGWKLVGPTDNGT